VIIPKICLWNQFYIRQDWSKLVRFLEDSRLELDNNRAEHSIKSFVIERKAWLWHVKNYTRRAKRHLVAHPKFYFVDCGIYNALRPRGPLDQPSETGGAALEGLVAQHLRAWIDYSRNGCELYFWRTRAGTEVDFVIYGPSVLQQP